MSRRSTLTGQTVAEENGCQLGPTIPGWPCPHCGRSTRSQVWRNAHIIKVHGQAPPQESLPPRLRTYLLAESECYDVEVNVELRVNVDKANMPRIPESLHVVMDDGTEYTGEVIDHTEGFDEYDLTLLVTEET